MFTKIKKLANFIKIFSKYPNVNYYGAPSIFNCLGNEYHQRVNGFYSQFGQDELIFTKFYTKIILESFPKLFIDIGCNHPFMHSNSYFFETNQRFRTLAIDALHEVGSLWSAHRPTAEFVQSAVGATNDQVSFDVVEGNSLDTMFSSVSGVSHHSINGTLATRTVKVRPLSEIFDERSIQCAGILSMDIEGYEYQALQGINFNKFMAYVFIVENNNNGLGNNNIRDLMLSHGYTYFARVWNSDDIFIHPDIYSLA